MKSLVLITLLVTSLTHPNDSVRDRFRQFIDAENARDSVAVRKMLWDSPDMVFAPMGKRDSAVYTGYWGTDNAMTHFNFLYRLGIHLEPDYQNERVVLLDKDVAEIFVPAKLSFPDRAPLPFLVMAYWVRSKGEWKLSTDIAVPVTH